MKLQYKGLYTRASLVLTLAYSMTFLSFYLANSLYTDKAFFAYLWYLVQKSTFLLLPLVSAMLTLLADSYLGMKKALVRLIPLSLAKMIYSLPYYYLYFVYDIYYDSIDALFLGFIQATFEVIFLYLFTLLIFLVMRYFLGVFGRRGETKDKLLAKKTVLNFADPVSRTFALSSLLCFLYIFIVEIIDTISIVSRYSGRLRGGEIAYIVFSYCFDVLLLALHYFVLSLIKNYIAEYRICPADEN